MKERPILFSSPMIKAILEGKKTQTRRLIKPQPSDGRFIPDKYNLSDGESMNLIECGYRTIKCPYGKPGDRLWVRETFLQEVSGFTTINGDWQSEWRIPVKYCADGFEKGEYQERYHRAYFAKRPAIHMPRWASRITLEICSVRVERVQDISEEDAIAEGAEQVKYRIGNDSMQCRARTHFRYLWDEINEKRAGCAWDDNPWVWAIEFRRVQP